MATQAERDRDRLDAIEILRPHLTVGTTVYTRVLSVSRTGMSRTISAHLIRPDDDRRMHYPWDISGLVARATGNRWADDGGVRMTGAGMDMAFALVYSLSRTMFPEGHPCTGSDGYTPTGKRSRIPRCPSNDHSNDYSRLAREYDAAHAETLALATFHGLRTSPETSYVSARQAWIAAQRTYSRTRTHSDGGYALNRSHL